MNRAAIGMEQGIRAPGQSHAEAVDTRGLGETLRSLYEASIDKQPIPDCQVDLILKLRRKERDQRRAN